MADRIALGVLCDIVKQDYGIELIWSERAALGHYMDSFFKLVIEDGHAIKPVTEALYWFMVDCFGLDDCECRGIKYIDENRKVRNVGHNFVNDPDGSFQEYCRRNVQFWGEERSLI